MTPRGSSGGAVAGAVVLFLITAPAWAAKRKPRPGPTAPRTPDIALVEEVVEFRPGIGLAPRPLLAVFVRVMEEATGDRVAWKSGITSAASGASELSKLAVTRLRAARDAYRAGRTSDATVRYRKTLEDLLADPGRWAHTPDLLKELFGALLAMYDLTAHTPEGRRYVDAAVAGYAHAPLPDDLPPHVASAFAKAREAALASAGGNLAVVAPSSAHTLLVNGFEVGTGRALVGPLLPGSYWVHASLGEAEIGPVEAAVSTELSRIDFSALASTSVEDSFLTRHLRSWDALAEHLETSATEYEKERAARGLKWVVAIRIMRRPESMGAAGGDAPWVWSVRIVGPDGKKFDGYRVDGEFSEKAWRRIGTWIAERIAAMR